MRTVTVSTVVEGPGIEAEQLWYDRSRWPSWIAGFAALQKLGDEWPLEGARRVWVTRPHGRGLISETVTRLHRGRRPDARVRGREGPRHRSACASSPTARRTRITVALDLETKGRVPPARKWWLRRQFRGELERSLERFSYELAAERDR